VSKTEGVRRSNAAPQSGAAGQQSPGEQIAAVLRRSPIYVDPSYDSALPPARRAVLLAHMKKSPTPIFLLVVPLIAGGTWSKSADLADVVHDRFGRDGIYVTLDEEFGNGLQAHPYGESQSISDNGTDAAWAVGLQNDMNNAPLGDRLLRCVDLIVSGTGSKAYAQATAALNHGTPKSAPAKHHSGSDLPLVATGAGVVVLGLAGLAVWRWRRSAAIDGTTPAPHRVMNTADRASTDTVRNTASRAVVALGEALDASSIDSADDAVRARLTTALDAYQAAEKVLDSATGLADLAGVLVLVDQGTDALGAADALAAGRPAPSPTPLCFFNPLHGQAAVRLNWRPLGSRRRLSVQACRTCAAATRSKESPESLMDGDVPYFEANPDKSVWATTGYGQFRDDLIDRILRGDPRS
jgi:hypothetical protein